MSTVSAQRWPYLAPLKADHVRQNWTGLFHRVPDINARVLRSVEDGDTLWSEWEMTGTTTDGVNFRAGGVAILSVEDDRFAWARFYLDPVDDEATVSPNHS